MIKRLFILLFIPFFIALFVFFVPTLLLAAPKEVSVYDAVKAGLDVAKARQKIAAENIANHQTINYKKKLPLFQDIYNREVGARLPKKIAEVQDRSPAIYKYEPGHPMADKNGMVAYPNVNLVIEQADFKEAKLIRSALLEILKEDRMSKLEILDLMNSR